MSFVDGLAAEARAVQPTCMKCAVTKGYRVYFLLDRIRVRLRIPSHRSRSEKKLKVPRRKDLPPTFGLDRFTEIQKIDILQPTNVIER